MRQLQSPGPLQTRTLTGPQTLPTHCLACNQELPFNQLPLLEIGGRNISQSSAMWRMAAHIGGLVPSEPVQDVLCQAVAGLVDDLVLPIIMRPFLLREGKLEEAEQIITDLEASLETSEPALTALGSSSRANASNASCAVSANGLPRGCFA